MADYPTVLTSLRMTVQGWLSKVYDGIDPETSAVPPKEGRNEDERAKVAAYAKALYDESKRWRKTSLQGRFVNGSEKYDDPMKFWELCRKLEASNHWEVWGSRKKKPEDDWKHELVDDEIANQIRAKVAYLTANWHDVAIMPNIQNISQIFDQEREKNGWGQTIKEGVKKMKIEGSVHFKTILDLAKDRRGIVRPIVVDNAACFPTPFSVGLAKTDGCWYFCYATTQTVQQVKANPRLRDLDWNKVAYTNADEQRDISMQKDSDGRNYAHTRLLDVIECWLDDDRLEFAPVNKDQIDAEHAAIHEGAPVKVNDDDNHFGHIQAHMDWLEREVTPQAESPAATPEDQEFVNNIAELTQEHINDHLKAYAENKAWDIPKNKRRKYPFGRRITVVGGELAEDVPNPFQFDWRECWEKVDNEKVVGHYWGRGDVEILWNTNKVEDIMLSRSADSSITTSLPKQWAHADDKEIMQEGTNDPTQVGFYTVNPPVFRQGQPVPELFKIYEAFKGGIAPKQLGVGDVTYGGAPTSNASGDLVELLIQQNEIQVTGEANTNLNDAIKTMVETHLKMYKQFYREARYYRIDGQFKALNVSRLLTYQRVVNEDTSQVEVKEIPLFEVTVKPNSNFPMDWEKNLAFLIRLAATQSPDGAPYVPREAVLNHLAERWPEMGTEGKYYKLSQATMIGMQVIEQQQAQEAARKKSEQNTLQSAAKKFENKALSTVIPSGAGNGTTTAD